MVSVKRKHSVRDTKHRVLSKNELLMFATLRREGFKFFTGVEGPPKDDRVRMLPFDGAPASVPASELRGTCSPADSIPGRITTEFRVGGIGTRVNVEIDGRADMDAVVRALEEALACAKTRRGRGRPAPVPRAKRPPV
jgi:hypothetical protein